MTTMKPAPWHRRPARLRSYCPITPRNSRARLAGSAVALLLSALAGAAPVAAQAADDPRAGSIYDAALRDWNMGDCARAIPLLRQYQTMARLNLRGHPEFAKRVQDAIDRCPAQFAGTHRSHTAVAAAALDASDLRDDAATNRPAAAARSAPTLPLHPPGDDDDGDGRE